MKSESERIAAADTKADIVAEFDKIVAELIEELNKTTSVEKTIHLLYPETKSWRYYLSTTPAYLQVIAGPPGREVPDLPPDSDDVTDAPIEIWFRTSAKPTSISAAFQSLDKAHERLRGFLPVPKNRQAALVGHAQVIDVGQWKVIAVGETMVEYTSRVHRAIKSGAVENGPR